MMSCLLLGMVLSVCACRFYNMLMPVFFIEFYCCFLGYV
jgi:hypothetical protein